MATPPPIHARTAAVLTEGLRRGASDWHLTPGSVLRLRIEGDLEEPQTDTAPWGAEEITQSWEWIAGEGAPADGFYKPDDRSVAVANINGKRHRFRVHAKRMLGGAAYTMRCLADDAVPLTALRTPQAFINLCQARDSGLILICGATGAGKSTTQTAITESLLCTKKVKIDTFESPIEVILKNIPGKPGLINQHEVPTDIEDFRTAVHSALRDDPDIVVFGELRTDDEIQLAVEVSKTGHLVFGTLHTGSARESIMRMLTARPDGDGALGYLQDLSQSLIAVLCQRLVRPAEGKRLGYYELMIVNAGVAGRIAANDMKQLGNAMSTGAADGMFTFDDDLATLIREGKLKAEDAVAGSARPRDTIEHFVNRKIITPSDVASLKQKFYVA